MKKYIYGALIGFILAVVMLYADANTNGAPVLTYVYSDSMEPLIKVNDSFLVWPASSFEVGDIIMYRPMVRKVPYITHRIIAIGETGYITKGDNSPYQDQESGEPEVMPDRIIGKVVTINGQPLIFPGVGNAAAAVQSGLGKYSDYLSGIFLGLGFLSLFSGKQKSVRRRKQRRRLRLHNIYRSIILIAAVLVMLSVYFGSRISQVKYLVSEYPGNQGDQVLVNQPGKLTMEVTNKGLVPVWSILSGIEPLSIGEAPDYILPRSSKTVVVDVLPQHQTGVYQGYVQIYHYPILLPRGVILLLHRIHPNLAIISVGLAMGLIFTVFFEILGRVPGFGKWIPLKAIRDKLWDRRWKRMKATLLGRRR